MAEIINGKAIASKINEKVKSEIDKISASGGMIKLASLMVGKSKSSEIYVKMQRKTAELVGIEFVTSVLDEGVTQDEIIEAIEKLNAEETVTAIIVQNPLPEGIRHDKIISKISPGKDAEGLHPYNLGKILRREADILPCTPGAIMKMLRLQNIDLYGKEVVIIGDSPIVGKPLSLMMMNEMATTTVCNIATSERGDLSRHARGAEIIVVAVGKAEMVRGDWVSPGTIVIDVGINKTDKGIVGDVCFEEVLEKAAALTPVPGGVGPVTVSILMRNVLRAYKDQNVTA
ncbi:MAG: bifunctional 5,10-methylenetetrahydrofolate dehydrogenase/5,10-methenyltetrahydrofolate cyclohydrolase [Candidatus Omnitrophica bacterium]|nr:bifunctional 5,10-methylenetetrahydrofolate dehydrogenase/5,10-methenyltetrahydrofolate cyclohydrolase [Candidatus Omnitrophota bacterium]